MIRSERLLKQVERDLARAAEIQKRLLPAAGPDFPGFDIAGENVPCELVGGDYFDFLRMDEDRLVVVIADVSGKGIGAALLMASLRAALISELQPCCDLAPVAARLNDFIHRSSAVTSFVTFFFGELDRRTGDLRYVNAGHNPPFVLRADGRVDRLPPGGFALGMFPGASYEAGAARIGPGDVAVLYTDGVTEARNAEGEEFSEERLRTLVRERRGLAAEGICRTILDDARAFGRADEMCDDETLVVVKRPA